MAKDANNKNKILIGVAAALIVVAGGLYYARSSQDGIEEDAGPADIMVRVKCSACGAESELPKADYDSRLAAAGKGEKLTCDKCSQKTAWKVGGLNMGTLVVSPEDEAAALDSTKPGDYQAPADRQKKALSPALRPDRPGG